MNSGGSDMGEDKASPRAGGVPWATATLATVRSLYTLRPVDAPRWPLALQAGLSLAVPIAALTLAGEPQLGYQAAAGAFTALHASRLAARERAKVLPFVAAALIAGAALGAFAGSSTVWTLIGLVAVTAAAGAFVFGYRLGPPGPLFFVLVFGISAHVAAVAPGFSPWSFLLAVSGGCLFSYLMAVAPLALPRVRREPARSLRELLPRPVWDATVRTMLMRTVAVAIAGSALAAWIDPARAYWVVTAGVAVAGVAVQRRVAVSRGIHRMIGTLAGAGLYFALSLVSWSGLLLALLLGTLQFVVELLVVRHYALALLFITPMVLLLTGAATGDIGSPAVAAERIVDTIAGSMLGVLASLVPGPRDRDEAAA